MLSEKLISNSGETIQGPLLIKPKVYEDERGFFMESWNQKKINDLIGKSTIFVQDNHSKSGKGVLRGLHYQLPPKAQGKLVRCINGEIFDVIVDIRQDSKTFGQWIGVYLDSKDHHQVWIPFGFAHGFLVTSQCAEVIYKTTDFWSTSLEMSIYWNDPHIKINWPDLNESPQLSNKDKQAPYLLNLSSDQLFQ